MRKRTIAFCIGFAIILIGFLLPENFINPVVGASRSSYNAKSFWYYPWGKSGTHKGVDIFAKSGTEIKTSTGGIVIYAGEIKRGGNVVLILGPKWRIHYYAHLKTIETSGFSYAPSGKQIGTVGSTGNAQGKAPHLHYSISTIIPYPWRCDDSVQGWKKMFYLDPTPYLERAQR
jgi:murein DD-endopeptidase MepM/ murein hydrolase activator NlpD